MFLAFIWWQQRVGGDSYWDVQVGGPRRTHATFGQESNAVRWQPRRPHALAICPEGLHHLFFIQIHAQHRMHRASLGGLLEQDPLQGFVSPTPKRATGS